MRRKLCFTMLFLMLMGISLPLFSDHVVTLTVPLYGKLHYTWGGAATGQMIMNGYPTNPQYFAQQTVWDTIQLNNNPGEPELWATDPVGLSLTMIQLNQPAGTWGIISNDVRYDTLFQILFWMNNNSYPAAVLVDAGEKWVVVTGYKTNVEPLGGTTPTLLEITINDPDPLNQGSTYTMPGNVWLDTYWSFPVEAEGTWYNKYVAVVEPPVAQGSVSVPAIDRTGGTGDKKTMVTPAEAINLAEKAIEEHGFLDRAPYDILKDKFIINHDPMLVREEIDPVRVAKDEVPYYYIIPYGYSYEKVESKQAARIGVLINAYSGKFEEIIAFDNPQTYITQEEAIAAANDYLDASADQKAAPAPAVEEAVLVYQPSDLTHLRARPFWRIQYFERACLYVQQSGKVHYQLIAFPIVYGK